MRSLSIVSAVLLLALPSLAQRHPHFDDKGALEWYTTFAAAKAAAKQQNKFIFIECGRAG